MTKKSRPPQYYMLMEVIYIDQVFFLNFICDYLILLSSALISGIVPKRAHYCLAAFFGALYACGVYIEGMAFLARPLWKLIAAGVMAVISFIREAHPYRCSAVFLMCSALFAGILYAISLSGRLPVFSFGALLLAFAVSYCLISVFFRAKAKYSGGEKCQVLIRLGENTAGLIALRDTGNSLADPVSGGRVLIVSPQSLKAVFGDEIRIFFLTSVECMEAAATVPLFRGKLRLIPYRAVGKAGMLPAFRPDKLTVDGKVIENALVAVSASVGGEGFEGIW